ncbi:cation diffusion facilitator family transporter [Chryseolinea sp. H1M3-3]|uniref:cation diffusion facilitator family transporter n=1 Tax=Chryseolinea sp. H1M3-3 TaxID=3034144 RepID=UPI0023ED450B|nr:cation diffusion facilitator family transporter [Chryseolinea sp. H1M3-3]
MSLNFAAAKATTMHNHSHDYHPHHHTHALDLSQVNRSLIVGIILNILFVVAEFAAGFFSNSLALISDAGHNLSDVASLALALLAFKLLKIKPTEKFTYGYRKASILISLLNAVILLIAIGSIGFESLQRFFNPQPVVANIVIYVAAIGIVINGISALLFFRDRKKDLNLKGAYLHLLVDALVSIGVVAGGILMNVTQWLWLDPLISVIIMVVILTSTWNLLRDSLSLSLDAVPANIKIERIREAAMKLSGINDIHHIHVWAMSTAENAMTAHLVFSDSVTHEEALALKNKFKHTLAHLGIQHATLETEVVGYDDEKHDDKNCKR